ncbi:hypothetical protein D9613_002455 [Agrocybe pediades]|uniref:HSF-type DNA-binding domain-containing protein n=1 Tax=Agrocybe pediades TaxID=84607 RepID=A0A8H4QPQ8_9AGAR|nr:hypothetical protein D9613_002455 [Agrocybe pediades]
MVNDPNNAELIRWSEAGDSFFVLDHERFAHEVLGRWFKHRNFSSFVRQLNMYGFHKIPHLQQGVLKSDSQETEFWNFAHANFHRGQPDLLCLIQRKKQVGGGGGGQGAQAIMPPPGGGQTGEGGEVLDIRAAADGSGSNANLIASPSPSSSSTAPTQASTSGTGSSTHPTLTQNQLLDIHSIISGITAIKRHQTTISAELNQLKQSNQLLWQDALAARARHQKQQDTINRIVKFLAGVFGRGGVGMGMGMGDVGVNMGMGMGGMDMGGMGMGMGGMGMNMGGQAGAQAGGAGGNGSPGNVGQQGQGQQQQGAGGYVPPRRKARLMIEDAKPASSGPFKNNNNNANQQQQQQNLMDMFSSAVGGGGAMEMDTDTDARLEELEEELEGSSGRSNNDNDTGESGQEEEGEDQGEGQQEGGEGEGEERGEGDEGGDMSFDSSYAYPTIETPGSILSMPSPGGVSESGASVAVIDLHSPLPTTPGAIITPSTATTGGVTSPYYRNHVVSNASTATSTAGTGTAAAAAAGTKRKEGAVPLPSRKPGVGSEKKARIDTSSLAGSGRKGRSEKTPQPEDGPTITTTNDDEGKQLSRSVTPSSRFAQHAVRSRSLTPTNAHVTGTAGVNPGGGPASGLPPPGAFDLDPRIQGMFSQLSPFQIQQLLSSLAAQGGDNNGSGEEGKEGSGPLAPYVQPAAAAGFDFSGVNTGAFGAGGASSSNAGAASAGTSASTGPAAPSTPNTATAQGGAGAGAYSPYSFNMAGLSPMMGMNMNLGGMGYNFGGMNAMNGMNLGGGLGFGSLNSDELIPFEGFDTASGNADSPGIDFGGGTAVPSSSNSALSPGKTLPHAHHNQAQQTQNQQLQQQYEERMQHQWRAAEDIDKDVNALNSSINSLIETFGLDPGLLGDGGDDSGAADAAGRKGTRKKEDGEGKGDGEGDEEEEEGGEGGAGKDFDFDTFFNNLTSSMPMGGGAGAGDMEDMEGLEGLDGMGFESSAGANTNANTRQNPSTASSSSSNLTSNTNPNPGTNPTSVEDYMSSAFLDEVRTPSSLASVSVSGSASGSGAGGGELDIDRELDELGMDVDADADGDLGTGGVGMAALDAAIGGMKASAAKASASMPGASGGGKAKAATTTSTNGAGKKRKSGVDLEDLFASKMGVDDAAAAAASLAASSGAGVGGQQGRTRTRSSAAANANAIASAAANTRPKRRKDR